jgi:hypothetical protein
LFCVPFATHQSGGDDSFSGYRDSSVAGWINTRTRLIFISSEQQFPRQHQCSVLEHRFLLTAHACL